MRRGTSKTLKNIADWTNSTGLLYSHIVVTPSDANNSDDLRNAHCDIFTFRCRHYRYLSSPECTHGIRRKKRNRLHCSRRNGTEGAPTHLDDLGRSGWHVYAQVRHFNTMLDDAWWALRVRYYGVERPIDGIAVRRWKWIRTRYR
jgi:hypothetical protein